LDCGYLITGPVGLSFRPNLPRMHFGFANCHGCGRPAPRAERQMLLQPQPALPRRAAAAASTNCSCRPCHGAGSEPRRRAAVCCKIMHLARSAAAQEARYRWRQGRSRGCCIHRTSGPCSGKRCQAVARRGRSGKNTVPTLWMGRLRHLAAAAHKHRRRRRRRRRRAAAASLLPHCCSRRRARPVRPTGLPAALWTLPARQEAARPVGRAAAALAAVQPGPGARPPCCWGSRKRVQAAAQEAAPARRAQARAAVRAGAAGAAHTMPA
jgi:hypothetical protein